MVGGLGESLQFLNGQQIRGKKKLAKVSTVKVHLLQNVPGYGRRGNFNHPMHDYHKETRVNSQLGAVVPVTAGVMRNIWYPKRMAEYLTAAKLQELGVKRDAVLERDSSFRSKTERRFEKELEREHEREQEGGQEKVGTVAEAIQSTYQEQIAPIELELLSVRSSWSLPETQ
jgi:hypothetical protein